MKLKHQDKELICKILLQNDILTVKILIISDKMLGKGHFEGEYRSKPVVNIRGASQPITRTQCIEKAHKERANREVTYTIQTSK